VFTLANRVGRLCELRYTPPFTADDNALLLPQMGALVDRAATNVVFCTDLRPMRTFPKPLLDSIVWRLRRNNPKVWAAGSIVSNVHVFRLMEQVAAEAHNVMRRVFMNVNELQEYLDPFLTPAERARRDAFLNEFKADEGAYP
jgi:hypothetical protein